MRIKITIFLFSILVMQMVSASGQKPDILVLLADDLGYADIGKYGSYGDTPNLDRLVENGIKFTNCYAGFPNCSPSRASLLTGKIPNRAGIYNWRKSGSEMHLMDTEITLAEILKSVGYQTAHFGKWHLGSLSAKDHLNQPQPVDQGFDYSFGTEDNAKPSHRNPINFIRNGEELGELQGYSCQIIADDVINWISELSTNESPRLMYVAFHEPHGPIASPPELIEKYKELKNETLHLPEGTTKAQYLANIENLDMAIGRIIDFLNETDRLDNTLILFTSDNGPVNQGSQGTLRGLKGEVYDGGIKVPAILSYPEYQRNIAVDEPIWFPDFLPTIVSISASEYKEPIELDGMDISPLFNNLELERVRPMFWAFYRSSPELALRSGRYSLIGRCDDQELRTHWISRKDMDFIKHMKPIYFELYDVESDPEQINDISQDHPLVYQKLKNSLLDILAEVQQEGPYWENLEEFPQNGRYHDKQHEFLRNQKKYLR